MRLDQNTICIVTGGASGLGLGAVESLLSFGCRVVIADFNQEKGDQVIQQLQQYKDNVSFKFTDVTDEESVKDLISYTVTKYQAIHVVLNSAGMGAVGLVATSRGVLSSKEMEYVLKLNVIGTLNVNKYASQQMMKQDYIGEFKERGVLINIASLAGIEGQRGQTAYAASKGAVIGMTLPMARDLGRYGIRVVTVAPGIFDTPMAQLIQDKFKTATIQSKALERLGHVKEFGDFIIGICNNSYLTGEVIRLDGGVRIPHL